MSVSKGGGGTRKRAVASPVVEVPPAEVDEETLPAGGVSVERVAQVVGKRIETLVRASSHLARMPTKSYSDLEAAMAETAQMLAYLATTRLTIGLSADRLSARISGADFHLAHALKPVIQTLSNQRQELDSLSFTFNEQAKLIRAIYEGRMARDSWDRDMVVDNGKQQSYSKRFG